MYWVGSGADKINDKSLALAVFDTAVNMGPAQSQRILIQSGNNVDKYIFIRGQVYQKIANNDPTQKRWLQGWLNRNSHLKNFINENYKDKKSYSGYVNPILSNDGRIFTREEIKGMTKDEFVKNEKAIDYQMQKIGVPNQDELQNSSGVVYVNSYTRNDGVQVKAHYRSAPS